MQKQRREWGLPRLDRQVLEAAEPSSTEGLPGFAVIGSRVHLPPDLAHGATRVTTRAFATWCDGSLPLPNIQMRSKVVSNAKWLLLTQRPHTVLPGPAPAHADHCRGVRRGFPL